MVASLFFQQHQDDQENQADQQGTRQQQGGTKATHQIGAAAHQQDAEQQGRINQVSRPWGHNHHPNRG
ncbi:hypothetical protein D3C85_1670170 [compost metagenome]